MNEQQAAMLKKIADLIETSTPGERSNLIHQYRTLVDAFVALKQLEQYAVKPSITGIGPDNNLPTTTITATTTCHCQP